MKTIQMGRVFLAFSALLFAAPVAFSQTKTVDVIISTAKDGVEGEINKRAGELTNFLGSYRGYFDQVDGGRVEYGEFRSFYVSTRTASFALHEHVGFSKKRVSNVLDLKRFNGRDRLLIVCTNTSKLIGDAFKCEAITAKDAAKVMKR